MTYKLKKDRYTKKRGSAKLYEIFCSDCGEYINLYQKDGPGALLRMYLDRIIAPDNLTGLQFLEKTPNLHCEKCKKLIATPMIYKQEKRPAYRLISGAFKRSLLDKKD